MEPTRRRVLRASGVAAVGSLAGCLSSARQLAGDSSPDDDSTPTDTSTKPDDPGTSDPDSLTDWERSTDCDAMHDSVIKVQNVVADLSDTYAPVAFASLPADEQEILRTVTEEGGYGTCDTSDAFDSFVDRTYEVRKRQDGEMAVFVERDGTYYGLYVEKSDQVYAY